jgi:8-hydroxy-5-deazaflavin:NADPH oxidoreductase
MPPHVGIIGAGNIGGNVARRLALTGHQVTVSFARDQAKLKALAAELGANVAEPSGAAEATWSSCRSPGA